ncbi:Isocitrate dehydrogenase kinase/phosphatase [Candidatus Methylobacter favarea]|uniref:Isocitrate dehydrogenase kinase/phosphatase n=1 Tax=Candidatus Methylobacter favarea TaxID=2707345 RepID=A0A8S0WMN8_9GAMM|nr:bifunctional isocitrate dehydrogenase kinase/phosphatase [Candidatus Methylobacter favarea]CAA9889880.1 Isocitrate dehydrogenase kinase/phosphatase [Candidatus Methylobacter favarea]
MKLLTLECAKAIRDAFNEYNLEFRLVTQRAQRRFENCDWKGSQRDSVERIELYNLFVNRTVTELKRRLGYLSRDKPLWKAIKQCFEPLLTDYIDSEFTKTFFNSITRRIFTTVGVDPEVEFVTLNHSPLPQIPHAIKSRIYYRTDEGLQSLFDRLLEDFAFATPYQDKAGDIAFIVRQVTEYELEIKGAIDKVEILEAVFFQITRAYLVGRVVCGTSSSPLVIALKNTPDGIFADVVMMTITDVSVLFSYTRSYFQADLETVSDAVVYLKSLLPHKTAGDLFTVLGRAKQGKTDRFRNLLRHMEKHNEQFIHAPGERGLVMIVFTLPTHDIVIKVIRDKFAPPKSVSRNDVMARYKQVFEHDRAGRLADAQEFQYLKFERSHFEKSLFEELDSEARDSILLEGENIIFKHCYIERRLTPLNLFLQSADQKAAEKVVYDYGQAIRDLALSNIFPGDLLLKNFGVSARGRVIFYDYDELCMVTDCNFRDLPDAGNDQEEMSSEAWFYVAENDIFPEQFIAFLGFKDDLYQLFMRWHKEILTAAYWRDLQSKHRLGEVLDVVPYHHYPF